MTLAVSFASHGSFSGPRIRGKHPFVLSDDASHMDRVLWLTSQVESGGNFGAVMAYDGTGMTAGLHQAIAVYPRELADEDLNAADDQGSLFDLIAFLPRTATTNLLDRFAAVGWSLCSDGTLRYAADTLVTVGDVSVRAPAGTLVYGDHIRDVFTPVDGKVPRKGVLWEQSKDWASTFHDVFSNPETFPYQVKFGHNHFNNTARRKKLNILGTTRSIQDWFYGGDVFSAATDLATSVFWSHSVNGPSVAYRILTSVLEKEPVSSDNFASMLLHALATSTYGRWNFSITSGRWARTRRVAKSSGLWPNEFFESTGIMPESFK